MRPILNALVCILLAGNIAHASESGYRVIKTLHLGGEGGWDYLSVDSQARRLYVSRGTHVMVLDLETEKLIGDIPNTLGVHGIALAPEINRGFISCGQEDRAIIFDLKNLSVFGQVKCGANPDAILFDPASKKVFAFNGRSHDATVIDAATGTITATLALGGKPEFSVSDGHGKVYVNIEDTDEIVEINSLKLTVARRFSLKPGKTPTGLAWDDKNHLLFAGCGNRRMVVLDPKAGKVVATLPIGPGVDGNVFDSEAGLAFSANGGDGTLTMVQATASGQFEVLENIRTQPGARTLALDPKTHFLYLPTAQFGPKPKSAPKTGPNRPPIVKDSFIILVVGRLENK